MHRNVVPSLSFRGWENYCPHFCTACLIKSHQLCLHLALTQRFSNWGPPTKGGPRRVPRGSARGFRKVVIVCTFLTIYDPHVFNWQSVQSQASTSITLILFAFHCNLYIIDDVGLFVKRSVTQEFEYFAVNFTVTSVGVRQLCLRRIGVRSQKSLKTAALTCCVRVLIITTEFGGRRMGGTASDEAGRSQSSSWGSID